MNDTELNIAIAEALGWKIENFRGLLIGLPPDRLDDGTHFSVQQIPDYTTDLNACHEAEEHIIEKGVNAWWTYVGHLLRNNPTPLGKETAVHATARQRAEALYLTLK